VASCWVCLAWFKFGGVIFGRLDVAWVNAQIVPRASVLAEINGPGGGPWGDWGNADLCPLDSFAYGFRIKVERSQGGGDDTALNAIELACRTETGTTTTATVSSSQGEWGDWSSWSYCAQNELLVSYELKVEPGQRGGDDTSANSLRMGCRRLTYPGPDATSLLTPDLQGGWGNWQGMNYTPERTAICGLKTKVEARQGGGDDTALNDVAFSYCATATQPTEPRSYTLSVGTSGEGTVSGFGIQCGNTSGNCSVRIDEGTLVTLTAYGELRSWYGCDATNGFDCSFTMTGNKYISAEFTSAAPCLVSSNMMTGSKEETFRPIPCE
jgi:hypothetical protein